MAEESDDVNAPTTLGRCLLRIGDLPSDKTLYLREGEWSAETPAMIVDIDEVEDPDAPIDTEIGRFRASLQIATFQEIADNLREQVPDPDLALFLSAFLYYYDHDAFLEVS